MRSRVGFVSMVGVDVGAPFCRRCRLLSVKTDAESYPADVGLMWQQHESWLNSTNFKIFFFVVDFKSFPYIYYLCVVRLVMPLRYAPFCDYYFINLFPDKYT